MARLRGLYSSSWHKQKIDGLFNGRSSSARSAESTLTIYFGINYEVMHLGSYVMEVLAGTKNR